MNCLDRVAPDKSGLTASFPSPSKWSSSRQGYKVKITTRAEARASSAKRYFTGSPCKHGHISERLEINGSCCECSRIRAIEAYQKNVETERLRQKIRRDSDPFLAEKKKARRAALDPEYAKRAALWRSANNAKKEAARIGASQYFTGKPCKYGHLANRFTNGGKCVECSRISCVVRSHRKPKISEPGKPPVFRRAMSEIRAESEARRAARAAEVRWWHEVRAARQLAIISGDKTYFGSPCKQGHTGNRYTAGGGCVDCLAIYSASAEKKAYDANYGKANRERIIKRQREYHGRTSAQRVAGAKAWAEKNKDKVKAIKNSYKARRRQQEQGGDTTAEIHKWEVSALKICHWCGVKCPKVYHIDHYDPLSKGGKHEVSNLVIACKKCNLKKSARDPYKFAAMMGRLF